MLQIDDITDQVLANCNVSDARHAGLYSICGLALRLRDLFKWENGLDPWIEKEPDEVLKWIGKKEETWEKLIEKDFRDITVLGRQFDPFDVKGINAILEPCGYIYGAGYARSLKPSFFLAEIEARKIINGFKVFILHRELARDLLTIPALSQDNCIYVRQESARYYLWDKIFYVNKSGRYALKFGLENYGLKEQSPGELHRNLSRIAAEETDKYVYHELGELQDTVFDRGIWRGIIAAFPHTPIELFVRTIKDLLADTNEYGTLRHVIRERKTASLALYVAFFESFSKKLFPQIFEVFDEFTRTQNWKLIEQAVDSGYNAAKSCAEVLIDIYVTGKRKDDMKWVEHEIETKILSRFLSLPNLKTRQQ